MTTREIIRFFIRYKYFAIFPVAVAEGPIITIISGFLMSRGTLSFLPLISLLVFADVISDSVFYFIGKGGRKALDKIKIIKISPERLEKIEHQFERSPWKTMIVAKASYGLGTVFMIASGAANMSFRKFLEYMLSLNIVRSTVLLGIGYYFGRIALRLGPTYLWYYTLSVIVLVPLGYYAVHKYKKRHRIED